MTEPATESKVTASSDATWYTLSADEALAFGLIERIVAPEDLLQTARDIAADTLAANPDTARAIKAMCAQ